MLTEKAWKDAVQGLGKLSSIHSWRFLLMRESFSSLNHHVEFHKGQGVGVSPSKREGEKDVSKTNHSYSSQYSVQEIKSRLDSRTTRNNVPNIEA